MSSNVFDLVVTIFLVTVAIFGVLTLLGILLSMGPIGIIIGAVITYVAYKKYKERR